MPRPPSVVSIKRNCQPKAARRDGEDSHGFVALLACSGDAAHTANKQAMPHRNLRVGRAMEMHVLPTAVLAVPDSRLFALGGLRCAGPVDVLR